jgi:hypothetical protein
MMEAVQQPELKLAPSVGSKHIQQRIRGLKARDSKGSLTTIQRILIEENSACSNNLVSNVRPI